MISNGLWRNDQLNESVPLWRYVCDTLNSFSDKPSTSSGQARPTRAEEHDS